MKESFETILLGKVKVEIRQEFLKDGGAVAFMGLGVVAENWNEFNLNNQHNGVGVGIRYKLNKKDHVNIRIDVKGMVMVSFGPISQ